MPSPISRRRGRGLVGARARRGPKLRDLVAQRRLVLLRDWQRAQAFRRQRRGTRALSGGRGGKGGLPERLAEAPERRRRDVTVFELRQDFAGGPFDIRRQ